MAIQKQMLGVKGDECQCGRRATIRHCPSCGSTRVYARHNRAHTFPDGVIRFVETQFRCQGCDHLFIDDDRQFCEAPPVGQKLAAQKVKALHEAAQTGEYLRPADKKLADALTAVVQQQDQTQTVYDETTLKNTWFALKRAWADVAYESKMKKIPFLSIGEFVEKHLPETKLPQQYIDQILQWQREEEARMTPNG